MPLVISKNIKPDSQLFIWESTEPIETLISALNTYKEELNEVHNFKSDRRKREWLSIRVMLQNIFNTDERICYYDSGKPFLKNNSHFISLTHSEQFAGLLINRTKNTGLDLQTISPRILKIRDRFTNEFEREYLKYDDLDMLHVVWCCKEALYKIHGNNKIFFKDHMKIEPFKMTDSGVLNATISFEGKVETYQLAYEKFRGDMLVYLID